MDSFAKNVYKKAERVLQDRSGYLAYIKADQAERDRIAQIEYGRQEGIEIGRKEGRKEGREKGREEVNIEIAKNLKNEGVSLELIAETTGLPLSKVKKL